jgi:uncharacterized membrane protein YhdT
MAKPADDFEHDPRYRSSLRETWISLAYWAVFTIGAVVIAWSLGHGIDGAEQPFTMGFPAWFFWSCLAWVGFLAFVAPYFIVKFGFTSMSLEPGADGLGSEHPDDAAAERNAAAETDEGA